MSSRLQLLKRLEQWKDEFPNKKLYTFLDEKGETASLTYKEMYEKVIGLVNYLSSEKLCSKIKQKLSPGDHILLVYPPSLDFIISFIACLYLGLIPIPVYPPGLTTFQKDILMFNGIVGNCKARIALTNKSYESAKTLASFKERVKFSKASITFPNDLLWVTTDVEDATKSTTQKLTSIECSSELIAFLQYTSGSTSNPKGVMIGCKNLDHNLDIISKALMADTNTIVVSWLPQYHDMGLIGAYLGILYNGGSGYYMSPYTFIKNPICWLHYIDQYKATHIQAPNFAYSLVARKYNALENKRSYDLSKLKHIINAAEPLTLESIKSFLMTFKDCGLQREAFMPTYGLAEHTVYVCDEGRLLLYVDRNRLQTENKVCILRKESLLGSDLGGVKEGEKCIVSCGRLDKNKDVVIKVVDYETKEEMKTEQIGEIWIDSPSKALGYFDDESGTLGAFNAKIEGAQEERTLLRTGDLGFICDGELFICGRIKDMIIVRGRNYFPQDIESTVEKLSFIRPGCSAAVSCILDSSHGTPDIESLVILAEVRDATTSSSQGEELCNQISVSVLQEHGIRPSSIALLQPKTIPKTTSGKIARRKCMQEYVANNLKEIYRLNSKDSLKGAEGETEGEFMGTLSQPKKGDADTSKYICEQIAILLEEDVNTINPSVPMSALGLDSLALTQLGGIITRNFQKEIDPEILYNPNTTINQLNHYILSTDGSMPPTPMHEERKKSKKRFCCC